MSQSAPLFSLFVLMWLALAALAIGCLITSKYLRRRSGLPEGEIVYEDVDGSAGEILCSERYGLSGRPDYVLEKQGNVLIPVEVKSGNAPRSGKPYRSHSLQLAIYFLLVEDVLRRPAPYGLIRYRDRTLQIANTDELREELLFTIAEMRGVLIHSSAQRTHDQPQRCAGCSMAYACDERLV